MFHVEQIVLPVGEVGDRLVAGLNLRLRKVNRAAQEPGRGAGLQPTQFKSEFLQGSGESGGGGFTCPAPLMLVQADVHQAAQEGPGGHDDGLGQVLDLQVGLDSDRFAVAGQNLHGLTLLEVQVRLPLANPFQPELVSLLVALGAGRPDRRTLLGVQHPELEAGHVGGLAHLAAQGIDLAGEVSLGQTADGGVAGHLSDGVQVDGEQEGLAAHPRGARAASMPAWPAPTTITSYFFG